MAATRTRTYTVAETSSNEEKTNLATSAIQGKLFTIQVVFNLSKTGKFLLHRIM